MKMSAENMSNALEMLRSVLCDPEGKACLRRATDAENRKVNAALEILEAVSARCHGPYSQAELASYLAMEIECSVYEEQVLPALDRLFGRTAQAAPDPEPAPPPLAVPKGYVLVPIKPTKKMRHAFHTANDAWEEGNDEISPDSQWAAMLKAAQGVTK